MIGGELRGNQAKVSGGASHDVCLVPPLLPPGPWRLVLLPVPALHLGHGQGDHRGAGEGSRGLTAAINSWWGMQLGMHLSLMDRVHQEHLPDPKGLAAHVSLCWCTHS